MSLTSRSRATGPTRGPGGRPGVISRAAGQVGRAALGMIGPGGRPMRGRRRGRGITGAQLRGFNKVSRLLARVGMVPKRLGRRGARLREKEDR